MADEHLVVLNEIHIEPADNEGEPLLPPAPPLFEKFRVGREIQQPSRWIKFMLAAFKVCFCSLGLWGHRAWNNIPRVLIAIVCVYHYFLVGYCDLLQPCGNLTEEVKQIQCQGYRIGYIANAIFTAACILSWFAFTFYCMIAKSEESALVFPSQSLVRDISDKADICKLFLSFVIGNVLVASLAALTDQIVSTNNASRLVYRKGPAVANIPPITTNSPLTTNTPLSQDSFCNKAIWTGDATQLLLHWVSLNICHIFAASCLALGVFAQDALRLIGDLQNGTLDNVISVYEDHCTLVLNTVSVYRVWFMVHLFSNCAGVTFFVIKYSAELAILSQSEKYETKTTDVFHASLFLLFFLYLLLLPCRYAAKITSACAGIYKAINRTTSVDWKEGHPFKDRHNIALFISYAKVRRCGFKVAKITFDTSLAWLSALFGLIALLYPFIQQGYSS